VRRRAHTSTGTGWNTPPPLPRRSPAANWARHTLLRRSNDED
jgi:hypothetical protein